MHRDLVSSSKFDKSYRKFVKNYPFLQKSIDKALASLEEDAFSRKLDTHKLSGNLYGLFACSCGYDCRIIFIIEKDSPEKESILLLDIGTHDDIY